MFRTAVIFQPNAEELVFHNDLLTDPTNGISIDLKKNISLKPMGNTLSYTLNRIRKLTPKRMVNAMQVKASYRQALQQQATARRTGRSIQPYIKGLPISISVEPTTSCNLRCPECPSGLRSFTRPTGMLGADLYKKTIDELHQTLMSLTFYFQGEPYLHPQFLELVRYATERNVFTGTSTNAHYLTDDNARKTVESGLDRLVISLDGTTQDTYQQYRIGGKIEKVLDGTSNLIRWKKALRSVTPHVELQFLVVKPNQHQIGEVQTLAKSLGVDQLTFKTAQIYDFEHGSNLMPTIDKYSRYAQQPDGTYRIKNPMADECWRMWQSCVMTWDGTIVPCCFDKDAHHQLGNLQTQSFADVWHGAAYQQFRQSIFQARDQIEMCRNCTEGMGE